MLPGRVLIPDGLSSQVAPRIGRARCFGNPWRHLARLTAELEEPSSEAVTVMTEDDFDLIKFGREPGPSNWILKPGEEGLVEYNTNLHKITDLRFPL